MEFKEPKTRYSRRRLAMAPKLAHFMERYLAELQVLCVVPRARLTTSDLLFAD